MGVSGKSVLVTGAGGFVGSHLVEKLVERGARVRAFVRYNSRGDWGLLQLLPKQKLGEIEVICADLRDYEAVYNAAQGTETIFHLGSLISIPFSYAYPREAIETNVMGALNVMSAARVVKPKLVIHTSTSEVYGSARYVPIDEQHPLHAQSPYSASKIGADKVAESYHLAFEVPVTTIRPFNTFGPRQSARAVIPTIITQLLAPGPHIVLGSLHPTRDYTYVTDLVEAFIKMAETPGVIGETINIGSGFEISIGDIARKAIALAKVEKQVIQDEKRVRPANSEVDRLFCNNTKAKKILGWEPKISFEEGLSRTMQWISANTERYKPTLYNV